jgi:uncharacterized protein YqhQ
MACGLKENRKAHKSKIGGQALFEGVMMRGLGKEAMAVRKKDGTIHLEVKEVPANRWYQKALFIRGVFNFAIQMKNGYSYLMKSFDVSGFLDEEEEEERKKAAKKAAKKAKKNGVAEHDDLGVPPEPETSVEHDDLGVPPEIVEHDDLGVPPEIVEHDDSVTPSETPPPLKKEKSAKQKAEDAIIGVVGMILGVALAIGLFMFLPNWSASSLNSLFAADLERFHSLIAGIIRIILFVLYMWAISLMKEIRMTYEYHGAEHMTIAAYEAGETLDPGNIENIKKYKRFHPRCGTSFIFLVLAISILIYSILPIRPANIVEYASSLFGWTIGLGLANVFRTILQILLLPFLVSISYEIIKLAGRYDKNIFMRIISAPGLGLQRLTTCEPNDRQLQVAVTAMIPVMPENKDEDNW